MCFLFYLNVHFNKELNPKGRLVSDQWFIMKTVEHKISPVNVHMKFISDLYIYFNIDQYKQSNNFSYEHVSSLGGAVELQ